MLEDIKDAIEKRRDLEVKDMQGATAVCLHCNNNLKLNYFQKCHLLLLLVPWILLVDKKYSQK